MSDAKRAGPSRRRLLTGAAAAAMLPGVAWGRRRHVVVVGGGPAGLSAALALLERGVAVTLCEAADRLGGKARGWTMRQGGRRRAAVLEMEHGAHAIGAGDSALRSLLSRYGLDGALQAPRLHRPLPARRGWRRELRAMARGDGDPAVAELVAAGRYLAGGPADPAAAAWLAAGAQWVPGTAQEWLWDPLGDVIRGFGGVVRRSTRVRGLRMAGGAVDGVWLGQAAGELRVGLDRVRADPDGILWGEQRRVLVSERGGRLSALDACCTHDGHPLVLSSGRLCCVRDGSRFDLDGAVRRGPAARALSPLAVRRQADVAVVELADTTWEVGADAVVLAVEAPAAARLAGGMLPSLRALPDHGYAVARFWLDRDVRRDRPAVALLPGRARRGLLLHRLQERAAVWADRVSMAPDGPLGSVIELQAPVPVAGWTPADRGALLDAIEAELRATWPELSGATVHERALVLGSGLWVGPAAPGVSVRTPIEGLLLAGDYVDLPDGGALMERAVATGRAAALAAL